MTVTLLQNAALLLSLCWMLSFILRYRDDRDGIATSLLTGLCFGCVCVVGMMLPFQLMPGIIYDSRAVVLSMAAIFGGPLTALVAALIAGSYRLWLGGAGSVVGLFNIIFPMVMALAFRAGLRQGLWKIGFWPLLVLGLMLHLAALLSMAALPRVPSVNITELAVPTLLVLPLSTAMLGLLLNELSQHHRAARALQASEARLSAITRAIPDLLLVIDEDGHHMELTPAEGRPPFSGCHVLANECSHYALSPLDAERFRKAIHEALDSNTPHNLEFPYLTERGQRFYDVHMQRLETPPNSKRAVVAVLRDITERKLSEERAHQLAFHDLLTNLPNRRLLLDRLEQALSTSARKGCHGALMFIDLDNFKHINDVHGHPVGDLFLQQVAERLRSGVRASDTVSRLGGDEFVVMLEELDSQPEIARNEALQIAEKLLAALVEPYHLAEAVLQGSGSIGIVLFRDGDVPADELLRRADLSMYEAKNSGKNALCFYDDALHPAAPRTLELELNGSDRQEAL